MKASAVLGLNSRTQLFSYPYNKPRGKNIARSKLLTKRHLRKHDIPVPKIYKKFRKPFDILNFDWESLPDSFALKPNRGLGGEGIVIAQKRARDGNGWITTKKRRITVKDLELHTLDILEGAYSLNNVPDFAFVEEFIGRHKAFNKYSYRGTPDIRVIVFNKVPIMAMLRLPTKDSGGRANLHQGAIGVGIDIATGITTRAIHYGDYISFKPGTKRKLHGIKIPSWGKILLMAVAVEEAVELGFVGIDIVLHPVKGPMVLEVNAQPGFQIQLANRAGLKKRLERVEDLTIRDAEHGVKVSQALFAASFAARVKAEDGVRTISAIQEITIRGAHKRKKKVLAKIDTGAWRTSISQKLAEELELLDWNNVLWTKTVRSALGREERPIISLTFWMAGKKITTPAFVAKRMALKYPVIIGRKNLKGMLVDPHMKSKTIKKIKAKHESSGRH